MKTIKFIPSVLVAAFVIFSSNDILSQKVPVYRLLGKSPDQLVKIYGKPVHQDKTDPQMVSMFYQTNNLRMVFVADKKGIYQAESTTAFGNKNSAASFFDNFILQCVGDNFTKDSLSIDEYKFSKDGGSVSLTRFYNNSFNRFEVKVEAKKGM